MQGSNDRQGSKLVLLFIVVVLFYLAFFGFDLQKAYDFTFSADSGILHSLGF